MENQRPSAVTLLANCVFPTQSGSCLQPNPEHEGKIVGSSRAHDVIDGIVEDRDGTFLLWSISYRQFVRR